MSLMHCWGKMEHNKMMKHCEYYFVKQKQSCALIIAVVKLPGDFNVASTVASLRYVAAKAALEDTLVP